MKYKISMDDLLKKVNKVEYQLEYKGEVTCIFILHNGFTISSSMDDFNKELDTTTKMHIVYQDNLRKLGEFLNFFHHELRCSK